MKGIEEVIIVRFKTYYSLEDNDRKELAEKYCPKTIEICGEYFYESELLCYSAEENWVLKTDGTLIAKKMLPENFKFQNETFSKKSIFEDLNNIRQALTTRSEEIKICGQIFRRDQISCYSEKENWVLTYDCTLILEKVPNKICMTQKKEWKGCMKLVLAEGVTEIPEGAFSGSALREVILPKSLKRISKAAFKGCCYLESVTISEGVISIEDDAFSGDSSLSEINFPNSLKKIGKCAFSGCNINTLVLSNNVKFVDPGAFACCNGLTKVVLSKGMTQISEGLFSGCRSLTTVVIPDSVVKIGYHAFEDCNSLKNVTLPRTVMRIGASAFEGCYALWKLFISSECAIDAGNPNLISMQCLKNMPSTNYVQSYSSDENWIFKPDGTLILGKVPNGIRMTQKKEWGGCIKLILTEGVTEIPEGTFKESGLREVILPKSLRQISKMAFKDCRHLESVTISEGVVSIEEEAFCGCSALSKINFPDSLKEIGEFAFSCCDNLNTLVLSNHVENVGSYAFSYCVGLTKAVLSKGMTQISEGLFYDCDLLTTIVIPDSVTKIGEKSFEWCYALENIVIPKSVVEIGASAFGDCESLRNVTLSQTVMMIGKGAFSGCDLMNPIFVSKECKVSMGNRRVKRLKE